MDGDSEILEENSGQNTDASQEGEAESGKETLVETAKRLATMNEEVSRELAASPQTWTNHEGVLVNKMRSVTRFTDLKDSIVNSSTGTEEPAVIEFVEFNGDVHPHAERLGVSTKFELQVGLHTDDATEEAYAAYKQQAGEEAVRPVTYYYVDGEGNYKKVSSIPLGVSVPSDRTPLDPLQDHMAVQKYESPMTEKDLKIMEQGLEIVKSRLTALHTTQ